MPSEQEEVSTPQLHTITSDVLAPSGVTFEVYTKAAGPLATLGHNLRIAVTKYAIEYAFGWNESIDSNSTTTTAAPKDSSKQSRWGSLWGGGVPCCSTTTTPPTTDASTNARVYCVSCDAASVSVRTRVSGDAERRDVELSASDKKAIDDRMRGKHELDASKYEKIVFVPRRSQQDTSAAGSKPTPQTPLRTDEPLILAARDSDTFVGDLTYKGVTREIACSKRFVMKPLGAPSSTVFAPTALKADTVYKKGSSSPSTTVAAPLEEHVFIHCPVSHKHFGQNAFSLLGGVLAVADVVDVEVTIPTRLLK